MKKSQSFHLVLFLSGLVWIGCNLHHPNTPTFFTELGLPSRLFGTSFAMMSFFSFLFSPLWGTLTDKKGRVKLITISCIAYGISQICLTFSTTELQVLVSRALSGISNGGYGIGILAYVVDITPVHKRAVNLAIYTAITSVTVALGYLIGGFIGVYSAQLAFFIQGIFIIIVGIIIYFVLEESNQNISNEKVKLRDVNPFASFIDSKQIMSGLLIFFLVMVFFATFASSSYDNAFNYFIKNQMQLSSAYNGIIKAIIGIIGLVSNFTINLWLIKKTDLHKSIIYIISLCTIVGLGTILTNDIFTFACLNIVFLSLNAIILPIFQTLSVEGYKTEQIGLVNGIFNSAKSLATVFGSLVAGYVYEVNVKGPFSLGTIMFFLAVIMSILYYRYYKKTIQ